MAYSQNAVFAKEGVSFWVFFCSGFGVYVGFLCIGVREGME